MFTTAVQPDELLVEIAVPPLPPQSGWSFMEFARRHGDYALIGVAAWLALDDRGVCREARLVYLNAGNGPIDARSAARLLQGREISIEAIEAARLPPIAKSIRRATFTVRPPINVISRSILTRRALQQAVARAQSHYP